MGIRLELKRVKLIADRSRCNQNQRMHERDDNEENVPEDSVCSLSYLDHRVIVVVDIGTLRPFVSHVCLVYIKCFASYQYHTPGRSTSGVAWICLRLLSTLSLH